MRDSQLKCRDRWALWIKESITAPWRRINTIPHDYEPEALKILKAYQQGWTATCYPGAQFQITRPFEEPKEVTYGQETTEYEHAYV